MIQTIFPQRERNELRFRRLTVLASHPVGNRFQRLTVGGPELDGFTSLGFDDHVKVLFPADPARFVVPQVSEEGIVWASDERPPTRDYTPIYDAASHTLTLDFYLHDGGIASQWAQRVQPGEPVFLGGPRGSLVVPTDYAWQLYLCDESGMPALRQRLAALRAAGFSGQLHVLACYHDPFGREYLTGETGIEWFDVRDEAAISARLAQLLPDASRGTPWIWMAGEGRWVKRLGAPFEQSGVDSRLMWMTAYWHAK